MLKRRKNLMKRGIKGGSLQYTSLKTLGTTGFEPATYCSQSNRATKLRYVPLNSENTTTNITRTGRAS